MYYFVFILYLISAVSSMTFEVGNLQLNIKLDESSKLRRQTSEEHLLNETDLKNTVTRWSDKHDSIKRKSMESDKYMAAVFRTSDQSSSLEKGDVSERDDNTKKSIKRTARTTQRKHKRRYQSTKLFSTKLNTKYEIATTMKKKKRDSDSQRHDHRQKSVERHYKYDHNKKLNSSYRIPTNKTRPNILYPNEVLPMKVNQSYPTFQDIIFNVLKMGRTYINISVTPELKENIKSPTELSGMLLEDLKHKTEKGVLDNMKDALDKEQIHQRNSNNNKKIVGGNYANGINTWQSWINRVTEDNKISSFLKNISNHQSRLFRNYEKRSTNNKLKILIRNIAKTYDDKFNEFIKDTNYHQMKSSSGAERVILNTIHECDRIIKKLFNYITADNDNKDVLFDNDNLKKFERNEVTNMEFNRACLKLGICRTRNSFTAFVMDFFTILLSLDNSKFEEAFRSLSTVIKSTNLEPTFGPDIDQGLKETLAQFDNENLVGKRSAIAIIKNIFTNRNAPLIVFSDDKVSEVNKTMAFIQIINTLDQKVPDSIDNIGEWNKITRNFLNYEIDQDNNIKGITSDFVGNINEVISRLDGDSSSKVLDSFKILFK